MSQTLVGTSLFGRCILPPLPDQIGVGLTLYDTTCCRVFKWGVQNWKDFCLKMNIPQGNYSILKIGVMGRCQKLGIILENKVILKLMLSKNVNNIKICN